MHTPSSPPRCRHRTEQQLSHDLAVTENPHNRGQSNGGRKKRGLIRTGRLWAPGRTLWVSFLGAPDRKLKMSVFELACQWVDLSGANLELDLSEDDDQHAQIRILTGKHLPHNESDIGTDALAHQDDTMSLNVIPGDELFETTVLHEFGHALGFEHEHFHPDASIPWNEPVLIEAYKHAAGWSEQDVREQYLNKRPDNELIKTQYDTRSIMHYPVTAWMTLDSSEIGQNTELSAKDIDLMRLAYPHD
ncbi:M12 family metallopeptidase [Pseudomonas putida]|uniref:M12 family metallopeptidase n=1 Tax=Pseudomonas putida TaxID=303 RepID=UPI0008197996|nr:M12 family metallopeptidase [Pseudomonas putida]OCT28050.1 hypothetical protein A6E23_10110 [Pseudomonas putida]OCT32548.1 hypothetical protein A6E20_02895 [Pseudomonas putida]OCT36701.1 hypothetical protein A6E24_20920 [Pseudomonas putida]OCT38579.1 hypothetical protein A6E19_09605 [Pseudomonas putida]